MSRHIAIIENSIVANVIIADSWPDGVDVTDLVPRPGPGWTYSGETFAAPVAQPEPEPVVLTTPLMTHYAFNERLTLDEDVALEVALPSSPLLRVALRRFQNAKDVNVSLPETQQMVGLLAQMGIVASERIPILLALKPLSERGAIDPNTGAITP